MLVIDDLHVSIDGKKILKGLFLEVLPGETHAIMGPNGAGKSTLGKIIAGHPSYTIEKGDIRFLGKSIQEMEPEERACLGLFLGFQYPLEIAGVKNSELLVQAINAKEKAQGLPISTKDQVLSKLRPILDLLEISEEMIERDTNAGFSGGEKKRNEILQLMALNPLCAILDETDSGLDIDALKIVSKGVNHFRSQHNAVILITHYQRLLEHIQPDKVHVLVDGVIVKSGDKQLALTLEKEGYDWLRGEEYARSV